MNGLSHLGAAVAALAGMIGLLVVGASSVGKQVSLLIYGSTLVLLFSASATYHLVRGRPGSPRACFASWIMPPSTC